MEQEPEQVTNERIMHELARVVGVLTNLEKRIRTLEGVATLLNQGACQLRDALDAQAGQMQTMCTGLNKNEQVRGDQLRGLIAVSETHANAIGDLNNQTAALRARLVNIGLPAEGVN